MARKPADIVPLMLRLRETLRAKLERAAKKNEQSMNAEVNARLEESFAREDIKVSVAEEIRKAMAEQRQRWKGLDEGLRAVSQLLPRVQTEKILRHLDQIEDELSGGKAAGDKPDEPPPADTKRKPTKEG